MSISIINVVLLNGKDPMSMELGPDDTASIVRERVTAQLRISSGELFALRSSKKNWVPPDGRLSSYETYELRVKTRVDDVSELRTTDAKAMDYYFHQLRHDFLKGNIPVPLKSQNKVLGLAVADMYRVILEQNLDREIVENDYRNYLPSTWVRYVLLAHLGVKRAIRRALDGLADNVNDPNYIKMQYVHQVLELAPQYGTS